MDRLTSAAVLEWFGLKPPATIPQRNALQGVVGAVRAMVEHPDERSIHRCGFDRSLVFYDERTSSTDGRVLLSGSRHGSA